MVPYRQPQVVTKQQETFFEVPVERIVDRVVEVGAAGRIFVTAQGKYS
jgi:hypothetical protein